MKALALTRAAEADLRSIWRFSAERWGAVHADFYAGEIMDACRSLAAGAKRGRPTAATKRYLRYATGSHAIYYRERGERLEVIRILHQAQDPGRHLRG